MHWCLNRQTEERQGDAGTTRGAFKISPTSVLFLSLVAKEFVSSCPHTKSHGHHCAGHSFRNTKGTKA